MIDSTPGIPPALEEKLIEMSLILFYFIFFYNWWIRFSKPDLVIDDVQMFILSISINVIIYTIGFCLVCYILIYILQDNFKDLASEDADAVPTPEQTLNLFIPSYMFMALKYVLVFIISGLFCDTIVSTIYINHIVNKSRLNDPKYIYVVCKVSMIVNLLLFILIFEFFRPSTKLNISTQT